MTRKSIEERTIGDPPKVADAERERQMPFLFSIDREIGLSRDRRKQENRHQMPG
jgi:hypothetical protein